jgi:hypothetical protein
MKYEFKETIKIFECLFISITKLINTKTQRSLYHYINGFLTGMQKEDYK